MNLISLYLDDTCFSMNRLTEDVEAYLHEAVRKALIFLFDLFSLSPMARADMDGAERACS